MDDSPVIHTIMNAHEEERYWRKLSKARIVGSILHLTYHIYDKQITPGFVREKRMDRLEGFEKMLTGLVKQAEHEQAEMERLKMAGKEKTATYRQYLGNRMLYKLMLEKYKQYGLLD